jgi:hypothetical protein
MASGESEAEEGSVEREIRNSKNFQDLERREFVAKDLVHVATHVGYGKLV